MADATIRQVTEVVSAYNVAIDALNYYGTIVFEEAQETGTRYMFIFTESMNETRGE